jgi:hypothetical protein
MPGKTLALSRGIHFAQSRLGVLEVGGSVCEQTIQDLADLKTEPGSSAKGNILVEVVAGSKIQEEVIGQPHIGF